MTSPPLHLDTETFRKLLQLQGPSLGLWRAAEIAVLRQQKYDRPILDLGCGDGLVTSMVLPQVEIGIDPNETALIQAESRKIYDRLIPLPLEKANIPDASISTIISNSVLEHIPELDLILQTVARILKPGGKLISTTPTEAFSQWLTLPIKPYSNWRNRQLQHLNLWSVKTWTEHLEKVGFKVEIIQPILNRELVSIWDVLELLQQIWIAKKRVFGVVWRRIPPSTIDKMAEWFSHLDLATSTTGGGRLIVARKIDINL